MASNRWWESYLVRYFMPSIAGIAIVSWLTSIGGDEFRKILFFGSLNSELSAPTLTLLVLYGNLFCYVASYPILGFHATRVIDYPNAEWKPSWVDGYFASFCMGALILVIILFIPPSIKLASCFLIVSLFSVIQLSRVVLSLKRQEIKGLKEKTSLAYGFIYNLAKRRGVLETISSSTEQSGDKEEFSKEELSDQKVSCWQREAVDTYRHMREHGNSAFIFFLELVLASICYVILSTDELGATEKLSVIGILFAIWAVPAASIHLLGQLIERRFSLFDRKL